MKMVVSISQTEYKGNFNIKFYFSDHSVKTVDFKPFLESSRNPMTKKYLDENEFIKFSVKYRDIEWNDFEMCFPIWDLYEGKIR